MDKPVEPPLSDSERGALRSVFGLSAELRALKKALRPPARKRGQRKTFPRCPKCRNRPIGYLELWKNHSISFKADETGRPQEEGNLTEGDPYKVQAYCLCGHQWTLKGILQITSLTDAVDDAPSPGPARG
jgi:hypothetical protein